MKSLKQSLLWKIENADEDIEYYLDLILNKMELQEMIISELENMLKIRDKQIKLLKQLTDKEVDNGQN